VEKIDIIQELISDNPEVKLSIIYIYADNLKIYEEASENIRRNGAIVSHPRTGAPFENPYMKIAEKTALIIRKFGSIKSDRVVKLLRDYYAEANK
jgi:phage terminase small subunit